MVCNVKWHFLESWNRRRAERLWERLTPKEKAAWVFFDDEGLHTLRARTFAELIAAREAKPRSIPARLGTLALIIVPKNRRDELVGDFVESIETAKDHGYGRLAVGFIIAGKLVLYTFAALRLRFNDIASTDPAEDEVADTPDD